MPLSQAFLRLTLEFSRAVFVVLRIVSTVCHCLNVLIKQIPSHRRQACVNVDNFALIGKNRGEYLALDLRRFIVICGKGD